ncbi:LuxR C-terminal-related transcriptional regulator [Geodermatophilus sp. SYSU D00691]
MSDPGPLLAAARTAHAQQRWDQAHAAFGAARAEGGLTADDLAALADCAWWLGRVDESIAVGEEAFRAAVREQRPRAAAMAAIGVAVNLVMRADEVPGSGWLQRAAALLAGEPECVEQGYLAYLLEVEGALDQPDQEPVLAAARRVVERGRRFAEPTLVAAGLLGEGRVLVRRGAVPAGLACFDQAMSYVLAGEVLPEFAGNIYCHLMSATYELGDLRRAWSWVRATAAWLETLPAAVLFTGICRVHRSQVLQSAGAWAQSEAEAARACADLADIACLTAAEAHYQLGELARLRGRWADAEESYRRAHELGRTPQPGLALLRLRRGRPDAADASIRAALLAQTANPLVRARLRVAHAEIALAAGDTTAAEEAVTEVEEVARRYASPLFSAAARQWRGALLLATGRPHEALPLLAAACAGWRELEAVHDCARVRVQLAAAYRALGDADGAELELTAAAEVFDRLGAAPDATVVAELRGVPALPGGLTSREAEVLALVAEGRTNAQIADALVISRKTVARHLSNIFTKLAVTTRTAASAWAHAHSLAGTNDPSGAGAGWTVRPMPGTPPRS